MATQLIERTYGLPLSSYEGYDEWEDGYPIVEPMESESADWRDHYRVISCTADGPIRFPYIFHAEGFILSVEDADRTDMIYSPCDIMEAETDGN